MSWTPELEANAAQGQCLPQSISSPRLREFRGEGGAASLSKAGFKRACGSGFWREHCQWLLVDYVDCVCQADVPSSNYHAYRQFKFKYSLPSQPNACKNIWSTDLQELFIVMDERALGVSRWFRGIASFYDDAWIAWVSPESNWAVASITEPFALRQGLP